MSGPEIDLGLIADIKASEIKWPDTAVRLAYTRTGTDRAGKPIYSHVSTGSPFKCRFRPLKPTESEVSGEQEGTFGMFHCPSETVLNAPDRIQLTHKWSLALDEPEVFELLGDPAVNALELTVNVQMATSSKS
jgi:hypothetical protein